MRKASYELINVELGKLELMKDIIESTAAQTKLTEIIGNIRTLLDEEFVMGSTNRRVCKTARTNFVKNNPGLLDAAQRIVDQKIGTPLCISDLFADKYLRIVITFVKDKLPDFRYFTYMVGEDRMLVKITGTPIAEVEEGEHYEPTF